MSTDNQPVTPGEIATARAALKSLFEKARRTDQPYRLENELDLLARFVNIVDWSTNQPTKPGRGPGPIPPRAR